MSVSQRRDNLVRDIVDETAQYRSWDVQDLATWDAVHHKVNEILQIHLAHSMMEYAQAEVGLDQKNRDRIWIEVEVTWEKGRDADGFVIFVKPDGTYKDPATLAADYDRAMGVV